MRQIEKKKKIKKQEKQQNKTGRRKNDKEKKYQKQKKLHNVSKKNNRMISQQQKQILQSNYSPRCIGLNQATRFCSRSSCPISQNIFLCRQQSCRCQKQHSNCTNQTLSISQCINMFTKKQYHTQQARQLVQQSINDIKRLIEKQKQDIQKDIQQKIAPITLNTEQRLFLKCFRNNQNLILAQNTSIQDIYPSSNQQSLQSFNKQTAIKIFNSYKYNCTLQSVLQQQRLNQKFNLQKRLNEKLITLKQSLIDSFHTFQKGLGKIIQDMNIYHKKDGISVFDKQISIFQPNHSSIIKQRIDVVKIRGFFNVEHSNLRHLNLIFKASDHSFNIKEFFNTCGKLKDTLILCRTNANKTVGAFSPDQHYTGKDDDAAIINKRRPFICSLDFNTYWNTCFCKKQSNAASNNNICYPQPSTIINYPPAFKSQTQPKSVYTKRDSQKNKIVFGQDLFVIVDKANDPKAQCIIRMDGVRFINYAQFPNQIQNQFRGPRQIGNISNPFIECTYKDLTGNQGPKFSVKQWEVWQLYFEQ